MSIMAATAKSKKTAPIPLRIRWDMGQSNNLGAGGDSDLAPVVSVGFKLTSVAHTIIAYGPTKGMQSAYMNADYARTGVATLEIQCAVSGTPLTSVAGNVDWSPTGTLRYAALDSLKAGIAAIAASGGKYTLDSIEAHWYDGEADGGLSVTQAQMESALTEFIGWCYANVQGLSAFCMYRTGCRIDGAVLNWGPVRFAQDAIAAAMPTQVSMLYRGAFAAGAQGYLVTNQPHITQPWLNAMGLCAAIERDNIRKGSPTALAPPPGFHTHVFADSTYTGKTERTVTVDLRSDAKTVAILVGCATGGSATAFSTLGCTFNGVACTLEHEKQVAGSGSVSNSGIYLINEKTYGATIGGISASIHFAASTSLNLCDITVIELDADCLSDALYESQHKVADADGAATPNIAKSSPTVRHGVTTGGPSLTLVIATSCKVAASPDTATLSLLTSVSDHGLSDGNNAVQSSCSYASESTDVIEQAYTVAWSSSAASISLVSTSLRARVAGEYPFP